MPNSSRHPCSYGPCQRLTHEARCDLHRTAGYKPRSAEGKTRQKMYNTTSWRVVRKVHLVNNPLCVQCKKESKVALATVVDHIVPHRGDQALFDDIVNYQSLCKRHHDQKTARGE